MSPYIIGLVVMGLSWLVRQRFQSVIGRLSRLPLRKGLSGREVAEQMLRAYGITDVRVVSTQGQLTDHYDPSKKTVNLSEVVYQQRHIAAAAIAAHECGHAVQHATAYHYLQLRSNLVPVVSIASKFSPWLLLAGIATLQTFPAILLAGIVFLAAITLFSLVTLPVEFDASKRALAWLGKSGIATAEEQGDARSGLKWAAMTYVVAALGSLGTLFYYLSIYLRTRR